MERKESRRHVQFVFALVCVFVCMHAGVCFCVRESTKSVPANNEDTARANVT